MVKPKKNKNQPSYLRKQGNEDKVPPKQRSITFSFSKQIKGEGQQIEEWEQSGLLATLFNMMKYVGQYSIHEARQKKYIKEYTKHDFPPNSKFKKPNHVDAVTWAVMHITPKSKEVVAGYIEDDVFYIIFLDKHHHFWPMSD